MVVNTSAMFYEAEAAAGNITLLLSLVFVCFCLPQVGPGYPHDAPKVKCETQVRELERGFLASSWSHGLE